MRRGIATAAAALVLGLAVAMAPVPAGADAVPDEQWSEVLPVPGPGQVPMWGLRADGVQGIYMAWPNLLGFKLDKPDIWNSHLIDVGPCMSMQDAACAGATYLQYQALLPPCATDASVDCIEGIRAWAADGRELKVTMRGVQETGESSTAFVGDPAQHLPSGNVAVLFSIDGVQHNGGDLFAATVQVDGDRYENERTFRLTGFRANVNAVRIDTGTFQVGHVGSTMADFSTWDQGRPVGSGSGPRDHVCLVSTTSTCALKFTMPTDVSIGLQVRLSTPVVGWFHGRFRDGAMDVSVDAQQVQHVTMRGTAISVPTVYGWIEKSSAPETMTAFYAAQRIREHGVLGGSSLGCGPLPEGTPCTVENWLSVQRGITPNEADMQEFLMWLPTLGDRTTVNPTYWLFAMDRDATWSKCFNSTDKVTGVVASNATSYIAGPPKWDAATGMLDYKVAAAHYLPDGKTPFLGTYDLLLRSDVARCIYGFSSAPVSASVSVVSADGGTQTAAVTSVAERDGWLHLSASGFTFSAPTVRVKLTQEAPKAEATAAGSAAKPALRRTITCVKGKATKRVTAVAPKCPSGWRKKA